MKQERSRTVTLYAARLQVGRRRTLASRDCLLASLCVALVVDVVDAVVVDADAWSSVHSMLDVPSM